MFRTIALTVLAASFLAAPAFADLPPRSEITVSYGEADAGPRFKSDVVVKINQTGLDPSRIKDASTLFTRIKVASRQICRQIADGQRTSQVQAYRDCRAHVIGKTVRLVSSDKINALYAAYSAEENIQLAQR